jgi:hypothetical protein
LYFEVAHKPIASDTWTELIRVSPTKNFYDLPPNTWTLGQKYTWRIRGYTEDPDTGAEEMAAQHIMHVDADGYVWAVEEDGSVASVKIPVNYVNWGFTPVPLDPGQYEVRAKGRNGLRWSNWSSVATENAYDSRKYQFRSGKWWAIPYKRKSGGTFTVVQP